MWFKKRQVWLSQQITANYVQERTLTWRFLLIFLSVAVIIFTTVFAWHHVTSFGAAVSKKVIDVSSASVGTPLQQDEQGRINVLLAGFAGEGTMWWLLTDSMMLVSHNPKEHITSFVSVPRDMYVNYGTGMGVGKLNGLLRKHYLSHDGEREQKLDYAANQLKAKFSEIMGVDIQYYALVDFDNFVTMIDTLQGVEINAPERLYDTEFPDDQFKGYITLDIPAGVQTLDGKTALRYARSRKSSSDFARSARQHLVLTAIVDRIASQLTLTNIWQMRTLYAQFRAMVHTNMTVQEMISLAPYVHKERHSFSYVLTADCNNQVYEQAEPWCLLYHVDRSLLWWVSGMLPNGATVNRMSIYEPFHDFIEHILNHQEMFRERMLLTIVNNIDPAYAKEIKYPHSGRAGELALQLRIAGLQIDEILPAKQIQQQTVLYVLDPTRYEATIAYLQSLFPIDEIITTSDPEYLDMTLVLGNSYLDHLVNQGVR